MLCPVILNIVVGDKRSFPYADAQLIYYWDFDVMVITGNRTQTKFTKYDISG